MYGSMSLPYKRTMIFILKILFFIERVSTKSYSIILLILIHLKLETYKIISCLVSSWNSMVKLSFGMYLMFFIRYSKSCFLRVSMIVLVSIYIEFKYFNEKFLFPIRSIEESNFKEFCRRRSLNPSKFKFLRIFSTCLIKSKSKNSMISFKKIKKTGNFSSSKFLKIFSKFSSEMSLKSFLLFLMKILKFS